MTEVAINFEQTEQEMQDFYELEKVLIISNGIADLVQSEARKRIRTILQAIPHEPNVKGIVMEIEEYEHHLILESFASIETKFQEKTKDEKINEIELLYHATFKSILSQALTMYLERCMSSKLKRRMDKQ